MERISDRPKRYVPAEVRTTVVVLSILCLTGLSAPCIAQSPTFVYTTGPYAGSISGFFVDHVAQTLTSVPGSPLAVNPAGMPCSFSPFALAADPTGRFLYVVGECGITGYSIDPISGSLTAIAGSTFTVPGFTLGTLTVVIDPSGSFLYVASNSDPVLAAPVITGFSIGSAGALTPIPGSPIAIISAGVPSGLVFHPKGRFLYAPDSSTGQVTVFAIDSATGALNSGASSTFPNQCGSGSAYMTIDPSGQFAYLIDACRSGVHELTIDSITGLVTEISGSPFPTPTFTWSLIPTSKFMYVGTAVNRSGQILELSIDPATGSLGSIGAVGGPAYASDLVVDANGFLYATDYDATSGNLQVFSINAFTGKLVPLPGSPFSVGQNPTAVVVSQRMLISALSLGRAVPNHGGNNGMVSVNVYGTGFQAAAQVRLVTAGQTDIIANAVSFFSSSFLTAKFDLSGAPPGQRDLVVTNPDGNTAQLAGGFQVDQGGAPSVLVDFIGRNLLRGGPPQPYFIVLYNTGNVDSSPGGLWVSVPNFVSWSLGPNQDIGVSWQTDVDSGFGLIVPAIPTGQAVAVPLFLNVPDVGTYAHHPFVLGAWTDLP